METADSPSLLNIDQFEDPFNYRLNIAAGSVGAFKPTRVDLVETFNYLLGLRVANIGIHTPTFDIAKNEKGILEAKYTVSKKYPGKYTSFFKVVEGTLPNNESAIVIWRQLTDDRTKDNLILESFILNRYRENTRKQEFDHLYVNGDHTLDDPHSKVKMIESEFKRLMFDTQGV